MALQYLLAPTFQFVNTAGKPLSGGAYMEVYLHGTRTKYYCASDFDGTLHPFRIPLDSLGSNIVLANDTGSYDVYAYNRYGTLMMSRYNVKPGAGGGIGGTITSTDGSIDIHPTEDGVDLSVNGLDPSCLKVSADPRTTDGKFHFDTLVQEGDQAYVDNEGAIRLIKGWYHFTANVQLAWNAGARNETHQVTLYTTLSNSVIDFDISHVHTETIELSGDVSIAQDGSELVIGVSGMPTGLEASVISMDVHAITGKDGHDKYYAGNGITISNENYIAADFDEVQEKLVAGDGVTIEGNVISAPTLVQAQADWTEEDTESRAYIKHKPDLDVFATKTEVTTGLAGKQNTIPDLAAIRSGAQAGASAVQPSDLAAVATTGDYNSLNNRPNLQQYATKTEVNTGLAGKQDVISDLSAIRAGAAAGATAVQPAALDSYATKVELNTGLSGKQDTINDLSEIRSGAAAGSTAVQPADLAAVATSGDYDDLIDKPTIPSGTQLVPSATASDEDKVLTVNSQGIPEWAESQGLFIAQYGITTYDDIDAAARAGKIVYCYVYGRFAFLAYTNTAGTDHNYEFQYYRSAASGKDSVFIYKVRPAGSVYGPEWETTQRDVKAGNISYPVTRVDVNGSSAMAGTVAEITIPTKTSDITNDSGFITDSDVPVKGVEVDGSSVVNAQGVAEIDLSGYATTQALTTGLAAKQDTISDLSTIRSGAAEGATAVQPGDLSLVATTGNYYALSNRPTIPTVDRNYDATSANAQSGVAVAQAIASIPSSSYTAGDGIDITDSEISVNYDSGTLGVKQQPVTKTYDVDSYNSNYGVTPPEIANQLRTVAVTVHIPGNTFYQWYMGQSAVIVFMDNSSGRIETNDVAYCATPLSYTSSGGRFWLDEQDVVFTALVGPIINCDYFTFGILNGGYLDSTPFLCDTGTLASPVQFSYTDAGTYALAVKNPLPASTVSDADKVLIVNAQGTPAWSSTQAPISAGTGIDITNNVVSVDTSVVATQADLAGKQDTISDLATIRSGAAEGATAVQPGDLATVATTGSYDDLADKPTIPAAQVNSDWNSNSGVSQILNKPTLAAVATTGDYDDLVNKPSIPAAQVNSDWNAVSGVSEILNKPTIPTVPTAGNMLSVANNVLNVTTTAGITDVQLVPALPASPVATVVYLISET